jgi:hypothetical protein
MLGVADHRNPGDAGVSLCVWVGGWEGECVSVRRPSVKSHWSCLDLCACVYSCRIVNQAP